MTAIGKELRKKALALSSRCRDGNLQSVFSCLDVMWVLYDRIMNWSPDMATADDRDFFIISKGQATLALYPVLIEKGMFNMDEIVGEIGDFGSRYCIQTDLTKFAGGIENNAGSLGHGLPFAVGIANANKIKNLDSKTFVLTGDGEFCEGTMWESLIYASSRRLDHLCVIVDDNDSVGAMVDMGNLHGRIASFGFDVLDVDGHDMDKVEAAFRSLDWNNGRPKAVVAKTVRGYGSRTLTDNDVWFHKAPNADELKSLIAEVDNF